MDSNLVDLIEALKPGSSASNDTVDGVMTRRGQGVDSTSDEPAQNMPLRAVKQSAMGVG